MSEENVEIGLQQIRAINRGDVDTAVALVSPDVEWEDPTFWSEPARIYRGRGEVREWLNRLLEPWESFHLEVEEITEATNDRVFAGALLTTRGSGSGAETELHLWFVVWVENGKITKRQVFPDRKAALKAAGLSE